MPDTEQTPGQDGGTYRLPDSDYVGEGWTPVQPGTDPVLGVDFFQAHAGFPL